MTDMKAVPLIRNSYVPAYPAYRIKTPDIKSGANYYFTTSSGLMYQVSFGKKKDNYLGNIINFSVISEDYEDEYSETNKGEVWKIIATVTEVIRIFHENHPYSRSYEFSGEFKKNEMKKGASIRTRLFLRTMKKVVDFSFWKIALENNKVLLAKKQYD